MKTLDLDHLMQVNTRTGVFHGKLSNEPCIQQLCPFFARLGKASTPSSEKLIFTISYILLRTGFIYVVLKLGGIVPFLAFSNTTIISLLSGSKCLSNIHFLTDSSHFQSRDISYYLAYQKQEDFSSCAIFFSSAQYQQNAFLYILTFSSKSTNFMLHFLLTKC